MDECLNEDDTEEPHPRFSGCFDAQHAGLSIHTGSLFAAADDLPDGTAGQVTIARPGCGYFCSAPAGFCGRSTGR